MRIGKVIKHRLTMAGIQVFMKMAPQKQPMIFVGRDTSIQLGKLIAGYDVTHILLVTDRDMATLGLHKNCIDALAGRGVKVSVYDGVQPDPTAQQMEAGIALARQKGCDAVLGFGGGSSLDAAKIIACGVTNPMPITKMEGVQKIRKKPLPLFAVPTTAGTGSEVTIAAVVSDTANQRKITVADTKVLPLAAALDPVLMQSLPPSITAATGADVLTHAVEPFISTIGTDEVRRHARIAVKLVFDHLPTAYAQGDNLDAREAMAVASYHAGLAISRAGTGYVHAIAHQLGGMFHIPHGLANAVLLPPVLEFSKDTVKARLAELAILIDAGNNRHGEAVLAGRFITQVKALFQSLDIPPTLDSIDKSRIPDIARRANEEALSISGVPTFMENADIERLVAAVAG